MGIINKVFGPQDKLITVSIAFSLNFQIEEFKDITTQLCELPPYFNQLLASKIDPINFEKN